jgi:hypothetical protein
VNKLTPLPGKHQWRTSSRSGCSPTKTSTGQSEKKLDKQALTEIDLSKLKKNQLTNVNKMDKAK